MVNITDNNKHIWGLMEQVPDPEIPIINLVELGVIREVNIEESGKVNIVITPTYTGCPAKKLFEDLIIEKLIENGFKDYSVESKIHPVWTTDWLSDATKAKLLKDGISPPTLNDKDIICPNCKSMNTILASQFGSTPCQSLYKCIDCLEPFNYFKCL